jgi:hypothetical protein
MTEQILASILWLGIFFVLPVALTLATMSIWADGATAVGGKPAFNNIVVVLLLVGYSALWLLLLQTIYLPTIGYDPALLSPGGFARFATLLSLQQFLSALTTSVTRNFVGTGLRLLLLAALVAACLLLARFIGQWSGRRSRGY